MSNFLEKFKGFELVNNKKLDQVKGGVVEKWCGLLADMHTCVSIEVTCGSGFVVKTCVSVEEVTCDSKFTSKTL
jgi:hypothetical protein